MDAIRYGFNGAKIVQEEVITDPYVAAYGTAYRD
jgi:hypothetical protein